MKIYLPSNGKLGIQSVEIRQPKISDLRATVEFSSVSETRKTQFVKNLLNNPEDVNRISIQDRDYLFLLAVASLSQNKIDFTVKCSNCGKLIKDSISLDDCEPIFLQSPVMADREVYGEIYKFRLLTVKDETDAVDYAMIEDSNYDSRFEDALVCLSLSKDLNEENIEWVRNLDLSVYYLSQFFQLCCPHGVLVTKLVKCSSCSEYTPAVLDITGDMLNVNMAMIIDRFARLAGKIDYQSFMDMSLPEYNVLVDSMNALAKERNSL